MWAVLDFISLWTIPFLLAFIPVYGYFKGVRVYEAFVEGASEGFWIAVRIMPYVVAVFVALGIFRSAGAMSLLAETLAPVLSFFGVPAEILPLVIMRPLSGGGALGITAELLKFHGPDSYIGRLASTMQGSTDTTFYILSVYFGSVGIRNTRHALPVGLLGDLAGFIAAVMVVRLVFGY